MVNYFNYKDVGKDTNTVLATVEMLPGIRKDITPYMAEGGWVDCDHIRFRDKRAEKIGGWVHEIVQQFTNPLNKLFTGVSRAIQPWVALDSRKLLAVAGTEKVELLWDGEIYDITPIRRTAVITNGMATTFGSSIVTLKLINHDTVVGDWINITSQDVPIDGINLLGEYQVTAVIDLDHFQIDSGTIASGSSPEGTAVVIGIQLLLENGDQDNGNLIGWGGGTWNTPGFGGQGWNRPRNGIGGVDLREWSLDNWGEDLIACNTHGKIYQWDYTNGPLIRLQQIANAPLVNHMIMVSQPTRFLIAFGSEAFATSIFDPMIIRWAAQETQTSWDINAFSTAGEYRLAKGNKIVTAIQSFGQILVFTDTDVYAMTFVGGVDIWQFTPVGTNVSCISQHGGVDVNGHIYWMGIDNFYTYDGHVRIVPCTLDRFMFHQEGEGRFNFGQKEKIYCGINKEFNELWWFYPRFDETECGHYIKYNYVEEVWDFGSMDRTVWTDKGIFPRPYALGTQKTLFAQETGFNDDAAPLTAFITTAYFDISDGEQLMYVDRIVPDITLEPGLGIQLTFFTKKYVHPLADIVTKGPYNFDDTNRKVSFRGRGRQIAIEFRSVVTNGNFALGKIRIASEIDGER